MTCRVSKEEEPKITDAKSCCQSPFVQQHFVKTYPNKCVSAAAAAKIMFYNAFILFIIIILFI